jgi:hypothetical protein
VTQKKLQNFFQLYCHLLGLHVQFCFHLFLLGDDETQQMLQLNGQPKKESHRDRMIRLGLMTPFGTVIKTQQQQKETAPATDFEAFLVGRDQGKGKPKQKTVKKAAKRPAPESESSAAFTAGPKSETSAPSDSSSSSAPKKKRPNQFDQKDFKNYDPEVDYTAKKYQRQRAYKMTHNFSEDAQLSGDEYQDEDGARVGGSDEDDEYVPDKREFRHLSEPDSDDDEGHDAAGRLFCCNFYYNK